MSFKKCAQYNMVFTGGDFIILKKNKKFYEKYENLKKL